jgi:tetratricopeptide (TPR) repeat protein
MRSQNRGFYQSRRRTVQQALLPVFLFLILGGIALYVIIRNSNQIVPDDGTSELREAWDRQDYQQVSVLSDELLLDSPLDSTLLLYNGIAHFYYGITLVNHDERQEQLNAAMFSLRKLLYSPPPGYREQIWYILGKVYFHKGSYYYDNAVEYFLRCVEGGYQAEDLLEYLGVIYLDLGESQTGIEYILAAIEENPRDILYFTAAEEYEKQGSYELALEYYDTSRRLTSDNFLDQEAKIGRGRVLYATGDFDGSKAILEEVIADNSQAAEAYFFLGEIYAAEGDMVKARANWREAYNQDRSYTPALERLQS